MRFVRLDNISGVHIFVRVIGSKYAVQTLCGNVATVESGFHGRFYNFKRDPSRCGCCHNNYRVMAREVGLEV